MATQAWFTTTEAEVVPGDTTVLSLVVSNLGDHTERYALSPTGVAASWTTLRPAYLTIFPGSHQSIDVEVTAPRPPAASAGPSALGVRVVPHGEPDDIVNADVTLAVAPTHERRVSVLDPAVRGRRRGSFDVLVENLGNVQAVCRLHVVEPTGRLDASIDTPVVRVEPGGAVLAQIRVTARRLLWDRRTRSIGFRIDADEPGVSTTSSNGSFLQTPVLPERIGLRIAGALAGVAAVAALWVGVVRPEVQRIVDEAISTIPAPASTTGANTALDTATTMPTSVVSQSGPTSDGSDPFSATLPGTAAVGQQSVESVPVPAGSQLSVTQLIIQNPFGDEGTALVRLGGVRLEYDLSDLDGVDANQGFAEPITLSGDESISVDVSCAVAGRSGSPACSVSATVLGRLTSDPG